MGAGEQEAGTLGGLPELPPSGPLAPRAVDPVAIESEEAGPSPDYLRELAATREQAAPSNTPPPSVVSSTPAPDRHAIAASVDRRARRVLAWLMVLVLIIGIATLIVVDGALK